MYNKVERVLVTTNGILAYYNAKFSQESHQKWKTMVNMYIYSKNDTSVALQDAMFIFFSSTHRVVEYQRQQRIHLCFKLRSEEISCERKWSGILIWMCLDAFPPSNSATKSRRFYKAFGHSDCGAKHTPFQKMRYWNVIASCLATSSQSHDHAFAFGS